VFEGPIPPVKQDIPLNMHGLAEDQRGTPVGRCEAWMTA
jgi:hypothetical protein